MLRRHEAELEESMSVRGIQALEAILGGLDKSNALMTVITMINILQNTIRSCDVTFVGFQHGAAPGANGRTEATPR